ncbi:hypothetical protein [Actinomadura mexicana]|uniref:Uncharacterized protein n=1 Tax=Actinomadura mexicana TaxID=134959 RepID=A0A239A9S0_9ACTN|nr:hypothetical protein [Actinomadura mexicana]SNR92377.1 hypothetical protein SAMN06265355_108299 [Actinomadura mexicana]
MTSYIVVFGLIVVVVLVVVLVALGLRASRAGGDDDDDWMDDEPQKQPRGRRGIPPPQEQMSGPEEYGPGYDEGYDGGYDRAPDPGPDRRVAGVGGGGPLAAPTSAPGPAAPPPPPPGQASDEMEDDDYWATITFDKPKFPWQHDEGGARPDTGPAADPLHAQAPPPEQPAIEPPGLTQPVSLGADGTVLNGLGAGTGPQQTPPGPGGFQGGSPFPGNDPSATSLDPIPADLAGPGAPGPQGPYGGPGVPDQPVYGGQEPQPAYGAADYGPGDPPYGGGQDPYSGGQDPYGGDQPQYGGGQDQYGGDQPQYGVPEQPQYGSPEPSYGDYNSDPLGSRPAAGPPPGGRQDYDMPLGSSGPGGALGSDPLGLPLGRPEEPPAPPAPAAPPAPSAPAAPAAHGGGSDTDGHKLPTVDELLQRIQSDRQRSSGPPSPSDTGGSYGGSLNDPLSDPLGTGSYGTTPSGPPSTGNTGPWPSGGQQGGGYDTGSGQGYDSGLGGPPGYGQGQQNDGYPSAPAYGDSQRYDDPLGGFGGGTEGGPGGAGAYGDFSGSSYNGGDPLAAPHDQGTGGYADPNATQAYGSGYYGGAPQQPQQPQQGGYPQGGQQNDNPPYGSPQPADDWENYRR